MNISDAERISAVLAGTKTENINEADLIVVVMCSVRQSAVNRVHGLIQKFSTLRKTNPDLKTVLTGCILKRDRNKFFEGFDEIIDIKNFTKKNLTPRNFKLSGNVSIMTGCNNFCSYCVVPYTRGREISRPHKEIICEIKNLVESGCKKIWLLGQNVNSYKDPSKGSGQAINFPKLLKMADSVPGDFVLNFTSSHPKDFSDELIETMAKCKKLSMDLNLPIQSGDDEILRKMNRPYTVAQYKNLVKKIRKALPKIRLSTDIIVGFPGENKKQFENTVKILKEVGYGVAFINKYSPRAGTAAAKLKDDVPWAEKKRREKILIDLINKK
jgi:tRNA-2-methylthio-N6-dimethylallyladenosine synthase